ncbi:hypothetical protein [Candidatus Laterigemmans baculatus]|uniref:hypothetical protein n=1 Tax=Candidatus Laterigemmans baculatus TaxID=2770505 RepID=UPI0013DA0E0B|nr:hypothetical protein [Candidatus Laterigemmans baculatus]
MISPRSLAVAIALAATLPCAAQQTTAESPVVEPNVAETPAVERIPGGGSLLRVIAADRLSISVYSAETSSFAQVKFATPLPDDLRLIAENDFVVFQVGRSVYAINPVAGKWARLELSVDAPVKLRLHRNFVIALDDRGMFVFGRKASTWQGINRATGKPLVAEKVAE